MKRAPYKALPMVLCVIGFLNGSPNAAQAQAKQGPDRQAAVVTSAAGPWIAGHPGIGWSFQSAPWARGDREIELLRVIRELSSNTHRVIFRSAWSQASGGRGERSSDLFRALRALGDQGHWVFSHG